MVLDVCASSGARTAAGSALTPERGPRSNIVQGGNVPVLSARLAATAMANVYYSVIEFLDSFCRTSTCMRACSIAQ